MARSVPATPKQILRAFEQLAPYFASWMSPWCRRLLFSMLHHTSKRDEQNIFYREEEQLEKLWADLWPASMYATYCEYDLRWCGKCLAVGYHSSAHQLIDLVRCPLHPAARIERGCPHCGFALPVARAPYKEDHARPARSCPHCGRDVLPLEGCSNWIKTGAFARLEAGLRPLAHWVRRVESGTLYVLHHEAEGTGVYSLYPSPQLIRVALEQIFPLPLRRCFAPVPANLRVVCVWLDRGGRDAPEVCNVDKLEVYRALLDYFGDQPAPEGWVGRTSVDDIDRRVSDLSEFGYFCLEHGSDRVRLSHPSGEVVRPATLKLWAHRLLRDYSAWRRHATVMDACTVFWTSNRLSTDAPAAGTAMGCLIEMYWVGQRELGNSK